MAALASPSSLPPEAGVVLSFQVSPKVAKAEDVMARNQSEPSTAILYPVKNASISVMEAQARLSRGKDVLFAPHNLHTNETFKTGEEFSAALPGFNVQSVKKIVQLYFVCGLSRYVCEADIVLMVQDLLDYQLMKCLKANFPVYAPLIGVGRAFTDANCKSLKYWKLLKYSNQVKNIPTPNNVMMYNLCQYLLSEVAEGFSNALFSIGFHEFVRSSEFKANIRTEMEYFEGSEERLSRITCSHLFTDLLRPLSSSNLTYADTSESLHPLKGELFDFDIPRSKYFIGVRALVLADFLERYNSRRFGPAMNMGTLTWVGLNLLQYWLKNKSAKSIDFHYEGFNAIVLSNLDPNNLEICDLKKLQNEAFGPLLPENAF